MITDDPFPQNEVMHKTQIFKSVVQSHDGINKTRCLWVSLIFHGHLEVLKLLLGSIVIAKYGILSVKPGLG